MSPERQRIAIAEACGIKTTTRHDYFKSKGIDIVNEAFCWSICRADNACELPDYLNDLNAMHEAKRKLLSTSDLCNKFNRTLIECRSFRSEFETDKWTWGQPAAVEVEALLRTIGKWEES